MGLTSLIQLQQLNITGHHSILTLATACQLQAFLQTISMNGSPKLHRMERLPAARASSSRSDRHRLAPVRGVCVWGGGGGEGGADEICSSNFIITEKNDNRILKDTQIAITACCLLYLYTHTLHPITHTLHLPYTLSFTHHTLHPIIHTSHPTPHTLHPIIHTPHVPYTLSFTHHTLHPTPYTLSFTHHTLHTSSLFVLLPLSSEHKVIEQSSVEVCPHFLIG